jgi:hypothetical protein
MLKYLLTRLVYGLVFAVPMMLLSYALASAQAPVEQGPQQTELNCTACHSSFQRAWEKGAHATASTNTNFMEVWEEGGSLPSCLSCHVTGYDPLTQTWTSDAITCVACHNPEAAPNHPRDAMPADQSSNLCGDCHQETYFEWQVSAHRESGLNCVGCHDPHMTALKRENSLGQCSACHRGRASNFAHSEHSNQGLTCAECHLAELPNHLGEGHARLDHSFSVRLSTCNACHAYQMHDPAEVHPESSPPTPVDSMSAVESLVVTPEPMPVSPIGFATLSGLFGLAAGVILGPWFERRARKNNQREE